MRCLNQLLPALCSDWSTESTLWDCRVLHNRVTHQNWDTFAKHLVWLAFVRYMNRIFEYEGFIIGAFLQANSEKELIMYMRNTVVFLFFSLRILEVSDLVAAMYQISNLSSRVFLQVRVKLLPCWSTYSWRCEVGSNAERILHLGTNSSFTLQTF